MYVSSLCDTERECEEACARSCASRQTEHQRVIRDPLHAYLYSLHTRENLDSCCFGRACAHTCFNPHMSFAVIYFARSRNKEIVFD